MNEEPLVAVNILSYNRKDELRNTLTKVYAQDYKNIEVIVVDNASNDGSPKMVTEEFPEVKLIIMDKNIGIAGWNEGFKVARGEYILVLDDDSYPEISTITKAIARLKVEPVSIIAFNIINTRTSKSETEGFSNHNPYQFTGCGALLKKTMLDEIGYFDNNYFIYYNEIDLCIRAYNAGFNILYIDDVIVYHNQSSISRRNANQDPYISRFRYHHYFIGQYIFLIKHFRLNYFFLYTTKWILNRLLICFKYPSYLISFLSAIIKLVLSTPGLLRSRRTVSLQLQKYYNNGKIPLVDRWYFPNFLRER